MDEWYYLCLEYLSQKMEIRKYQYIWPHKTWDQKFSINPNIEKEWKDIITETFLAYNYGTTFFFFNDQRIPLVHKLTMATRNFLLLLDMDSSSISSSCLKTFALQFCDNLIHWDLDILTALQLIKFTH